MNPAENRNRETEFAFFENRIRPVLVEHCYSCHSENAEDIVGGLLLDSRAAIRKGGDTGPAVVPGGPEKSLLLKAILYTNRDLQMPPDNRLPKQVVDDFRKWIEQGAADPRAHSPVRKQKAFDLLARRESHWAWKKPDGYPGATVDLLVNKKLQKQGLDPVPMATPRELARRMTFDLIGLPPLPAEIAAYERDCLQDRKAATEKLVDRLLRDPRFGEHWARHWLDVVRYSETKGHVTDQEKPFAWRYRDYLIEAFNADVPYDQLVREHLAGDLLPPGEIRPGKNGIDNVSVIATSALYMHEIHFMAVDPVKQRWDEINAQIDVVGKAFLGLTTECARCHDHKFDAISQKDYYALAGIFWSTELGKSRTGKREALDKSKQARVGQLENELDKFLAGKREQRRKAQSPKAGGKYFPISDELGIQSPNDTRQLMNRINAIVALDPSWSRWTRAAKDVKPSDVHLLIRGEHRSEGELVPRGFLTAMGRAEPRNTPSGLEVVLGSQKQHQSGRLWLARQLVHPDNPLTARVWVNRLWHHLFGRGIVATPNNFGKLGAAPDNQELLDFLAGELVELQWSTKSLIRRVVLSDTYQRSSRAPVDLVRRDPQNRYLARHSRRRLTAEQLRDSMLFVAGVLDEQRLGPSVDVYTPPYATGNKPSNVPRSGPLDGANRRSVYIKVRRNFFDPFLRTFDFPNPGKSIGRRTVTVVPTQSLALLNSPLVHEIAADWGANISGDPLKVESTIEAMWVQAIGRGPDESEREAALELVAALKGDRQGKALWKELAHLLFNHPEFLWID